MSVRPNLRQPEGTSTGALSDDPRHKRPDRSGRYKDRGPEPDHAMESLSQRLAGARGNRVC